MCGQRTDKGPVGRAAKMRRRTLLETIEIYTTPYRCLNSMIIRHESRSYQQGEMRTGNAFAQLGHHATHPRGEFGRWECDSSPGDLW